MLETSLKQPSIVCFKDKSQLSFVKHKIISELSFKQPNDPENCKTIILENTDVEVTNEATWIHNHLDISVLACTENSVKIWENRTLKKLRKQLKNRLVLVMTPQTLLKYFKIDKALICSVKLIIFQECDKILNEQHPYNCVMNYVDTAFGEGISSAAIYGMSSSLLKHDPNVEQLTAKIAQMEMKYHSKAYTATDLIAHNVHAMAMPEEQIILSSQDKTKELELYKSVHKRLKDVYDQICNSQISSATFGEVRDFEVVNIVNTDEEEMKRQAREKNGGGGALPVGFAASKEYLQMMIDVLETLGLWSVYR